MFGCGLVCSSSTARFINLGFPLTIGIIILRIGNHGKDITGIAIGGIAINSIIMEGIFGRQPMSDAQRSMLITEAIEYMRVQSRRVIITAMESSKGQTAEMGTTKKKRGMVKTTMDIQKRVVERVNPKPAKAVNTAREVTSMSLLSRPASPILSHSQ